VTAAVFAVVSPLQYINALEAVHAFGLRPSDCYLAVGLSRKLPASAIQVQKLLDRSQWRAVETVSGFPSTAGSNRAHTGVLTFRGAREYASAANGLLDRARRDHGKISHLFIGDFRPANFRHFMAQAAEAELWLLDDGSITHQVVRYRKDATSPHAFGGQFARQNVRDKLRTRLSGLKYANPERLGFFTCYDLDPPPQDVVRSHGYERYKQVYGNLTCSDEIWFLGANHAENEFASMDRYLGLLRRVLEFYGDQPVVYLPHRGESKEKLAVVAGLGFEVRSFDLPVEIVIGQSGVFPRTLAGIASSAIDNLSVILGDRIQIHVFRVASGYCEGGRWKHLSDVIEYHELDVADVTTFVHEDDGLRLGGPGVDLRLVHPSASAGGGYFTSSDGWLRGIDYSETEFDCGTGPLELSLVASAPRRVWHKGDALTIRPIGALGELEGVVQGCTPMGRLSVLVHSCTATGTFRHWHVERSMGRLECGPTEGAIAGCLIEPETTNMLPVSDSLDAPGWLWSGLASCGEGSVARVTLLKGPDARHRSAFAQLDHGTGPHEIRHRLSGASTGTPLTLSIYARGGGCERITLTIEHPASGSRASATFPLDALVAAPVSEVLGTATIDSLHASDTRHGWRRYEFTARLPEGDCEIAFCIAPSLASDLPGDGCSGAYFWGPQLEPATRASSYIPTYDGSLRRKGGRLAFDVPAGETRILLEFSTLQASTDLELASFSDQSVLRYAPETGVLTLSGPGGATTGTGVPSGAGQPLSLMLFSGMQGMRILCSDHVAVERAAPLPSGVAFVQGGPVHVRRIAVLDDQ